MKYKIRLIYIILLIMICNFTLNTYSVNASINDKSFIRLDILSGFSSNNITCVHQDSNGYMWVGTVNGLNKYNGNNVKVFNYEIGNDKSLSSTYITSIFEDDEGRIWVGTKNGLNIIESKSDEVIRVSVGITNDRGLSNEKITSIFQDGTGNIWIGTENGLNRYNAEKDIFVKYLADSDDEKALSNNYITSIEEDINGYLWIGTKNGINAINSRDNDKVLSGHRFINERKYIYHIENDNLGNVWMATDEGIYVYNIKDNSLNKFYLDINENLNTNVEYIYADSNDNIWFASTNVAIKYCQEQKEFTIYKNDKSRLNSLSDDDVKCFYEDKYGGIWIGTSNGLNVLNESNQFSTLFSKYYVENNYEKYRNITELFEDSYGQVWIGTKYNGLFKRDENTGEIYKIYYSNSDDLINSNAINQIIEGKDEDLIVATRSGIVIVNKKTNEYIKLVEDEIGTAYKEEIKSIYYDGNDILWIGSQYGLYSYNMNTKEFKDYKDLFEKEGIDDIEISYIYSEDKDNNILWIGTKDFGLIKFNKNSGIEKIFIHDINDEKSISYKAVNCIISDDVGSLWISTDYGLNRFDIESEEFINYTEEDGLISNYIQAIAKDSDNNLWIATNKGISKLYSDTDKIVNFNNIDGVTTEGYNNNAVYFFNNKWMVFGGKTEITLFEPKKIQDNNNVLPEVVIDYIKVNDITEYNTDDIELSYKNNNIKIEYFYPNFIEAKKSTYEYMMEGIDEDWVYANKETSAKYQALQPGKYVFKVRAINNNGQAGEITTINIKIREPFWKTSFAYIIYFIIIVLIIFIVFNYMRILGNLVEERTSELNEEMEKNKKLYGRLIEEEKFKNTFFVNLSHELRTPVNVIMSTVQILELYHKKNEKIDITKYTNIIKKSSNNLLNIIRDIIDTSKIETGHYNLNKKNVDIVYVVEEAALNMSEYIKSNGIKLVIDPEIEEKQVLCDATEIERCVVNLLSNAVKFTPDGGTINVFINDKGNFVDIIVEDTGDGISKEDQDFIFNRFEQGKNMKITQVSSSGIGLTLVKYIVELHGGTIKLESEIGKGSKFTITLPVGL